MYLFYTYTIIYGCIKSYKNIFIFTLTQSPKPFTHTTRVSAWSSIQRGKSLKTHFAKQAVACTLILSEPLSSLCLALYNLNTLQCSCFSHHFWFLFYICVKDLEFERAPNHSKIPKGNCKAWLSTRSVHVMEVNQ